METRFTSAALVHFDGFELNLRSGELRRDGKPVNLQPQPARVLALLVSRAGQAVTRQEIAQQVWGKETFVDFEQGLNYAVRHIRTALEDDADHPQYVETIPKRGYRFIGKVEPHLEPELPPTPVLQAEPKTPQQLSNSSRTMWIAFAVVITLIAGVVALGIRNGGPKPAALAIHSIAVLPLANLSPDPSQDYFTDGLTDELITELAQMKATRVISRTSSMAYKDRRERVSQIGRELGADAIVEGTVERSGTRVRIRAQLIDAVNDRHLWAQSYDGDSGDIFLLEREVATDIARQIGHVSSVQNAAEEARIPPSAHDDYLRGRYYWNKRTEAGLRRGIEYFQKAIDQEPAYALAYSGLADSYIMLANWGFTPAADAYPKAMAAARKAVELNDQLAEGQTSLAYVTLLYERNWDIAEDEFRRAIALNPNYASAHHFYSICLMTAGRQSEALAEIRRAQELDPLSLIVNDVVGWIYYEGRQYEKAVQQYVETLQMDSNYAPVLLDEGTAYMRMGQYARAIEELQKARTITGDSGVLLSNLAQVYALSGNLSGVQQILRKVQPGGQVFMSEWDLALIHLALGEKQKGIELLSKAAEKHSGWIILLGIDPSFDGIRSEPRFQQLLRRARIPANLA